MSRGPVVKQSGTVPHNGEAPNSFGAVLFDFMENVAGWNVYHDQNPLSKIWAPLGDDSDSDGDYQGGYINTLVFGQALILLMHTDWSIPDVAGADTEPAIAASTAMIIPFPSQDVDYYFVADRGEIAILWKQASDTSWKIASFGAYPRSGVPYGQNGTAKHLAGTPVSAGASAVVGIDRDLRGSLVVGQQIALIRQTPPGDSLVGPIWYENTTVEAINETSIQVANLANAILIGDQVCVGMFPVAIFATTNTGTNFTSYPTAWNARFYSTVNSIGTHTANNRWINSGDIFGLITASPVLGTVARIINTQLVSADLLFNAECACASRFLYCVAADLFGGSKGYTVEDIIYPNDGGVDGVVISDIQFDIVVRTLWVWAIRWPGV